MITIFKGRNPYGGVAGVDMDKVDIFLDDNGLPTIFLSIPKDDIARLSLAPHKWLIYVMFAICGAHGVLSATPGGPPVQNDTVFSDILRAYYFTPQKG